MNRMNRTHLFGFNIRSIPALVIFIMVLNLFAIDAGAQDDCGTSTIEEAEASYEVGGLIEALGLIKPCIDGNKFKGKEEIAAYRIYIKTYLGLESSAKAIKAISDLLEISPNYEPPLEDPPRIQEIIDSLNSQETEIQITSVSKKKEDLREAPATVMVITEEDIKNRGYVDLEALFSDLPGFDVSRTIGSTYSNIYQRGYRSDNTNRTLFLIDGIEENDLYYGQAYISRQYPITNVKRVEVVYGPASTMYGANAFLGVINIITKAPEDICVIKKKKRKENEENEEKAKPSFGAIANGGVGTYNTYYGDITVAAKWKNISLSVTGRGFFSDEMDLSSYPEYDFDPADYDTVDYKSILDVSDNANLFADTNNITSASTNYTVVTDPITGDTTSVELTDAGEVVARNLDKAALEEEVDGHPIGYSNLSKELFLNAKLKIAGLTLGFQEWKYEQGSANYINDRRRPGAKNGGVWSPEQSLFYAMYDMKVDDKLSLTNIAQYKISEISDDSKLTDLKNYSNGALGVSDFIISETPYWKTTYYYQISRQFRNELKASYSPNKKTDIVSGFEVRNSSIYGNFRTTTYDTASVIEIGESSLDDEPGSNDFTIYDFGFYVQGDYHMNDLIKLTLGGRFDKNRIRIGGGYGGIFNPRVAIVVTPQKFIFKGIYATAFKDASNFQKYSTSDQRELTNPQLQPEKATNFEFSAGYRPDKNLYADIVTYYALYTGAIGTKIVEYGSGTTGKIDNVGSIKIFGIQSTLAYKINNYNLYWNYTYANPQVDSVDDDGVSTGVFQRGGDIAGHRINLGVNALYFEHLNVNLRMNYTGERPVGYGTSVPLNPSNFPAFVLFNGAIAYKDVVPGLNVQLVCNNILNLEYFDPGIRDASGLSYTYRTPQRRRNFMLRVYYDLK